MINNKIFLVGLSLAVILICGIQELAYAQVEENDNEEDGSNDIQRIVTAPQSNLNITSSTSYFDGDYFYIVGEVLNSASTTKEFVKVISTLYGENNNVIGTEYTYTDPSTIPSSETAPFKLMIGPGDVSNIESIKSYKIIASDD